MEVRANNQASPGTWFQAECRLLRPYEMVPGRKFKVWGSLIPGKLDALEAQHADTPEPSAMFAKVSQIGKAPVRPTVGG